MFLIPICLHRDLVILRFFVDLRGAIQSKMKTGGVAAGSVAAGIQSSIGAVSAGSLFATLQSVGAVGLSTSAQAIIGGIGAVSAGIIKKVSNKENETNDDKISDDANSAQKNATSSKESEGNDDEPNRRNDDDEGLEKVYI